MSNVLLVCGVWCVCGAEVCCKAVKLFRCQQLLWCGARRRQRHHNRGSAPSARRCSVLYLVIGGRCILRQTTKINAEAELQICKTFRYVLFSHVSCYIMYISKLIAVVNSRHLYLSRLPYYIVYLKGFFIGNVKSLCFLKRLGQMHRSVACRL